MLEETPVPVQPSPRQVVDIVNQTPTPSQNSDNAKTEKKDKDQTAKADKPAQTKPKGSKSPVGAILLALLISISLIATAIYIKMRS